MPSANLYETQNLYEAAYCLAKGMRLVGKVRVGKRVAIHLEGKDSHLEAMKFYGTTKVDAKTLFDCYRRLKDFIFQG